MVNEYFNCYVIFGYATVLAVSTHIRNTAAACTNPTYRADLTVALTRVFLHC
jgi:hypothetical protein